MTDLTMTWGDEYDIPLVFSNVDSLAGKALVLMVKRSYGDADSAAVISKSLTDGITDTSNGGVVSALVTIDAADTKTLPNRETVLLWAARLDDVTVNSGRLTVLPSVIVGS